MINIQASFQTPVLLNKSGEGRYDEKCKQKLLFLKMKHTTE